MDAVTKLSEVQRARRLNLKKLIAAQYDGNASLAGRSLKFSHTYMWQITSGHRGIGEKSAREIERRFKLPPYSLDQNGLRRTRELAAMERDGRSLIYLIVPVRSLAAIDEETPEARLCPVDHCPKDAFAVIADAHTEAAMVEFREGDVLFVAPLAKGEQLVHQGLYVVRVRGKRSGRVLQARAVADGGFTFATTDKRMEVTAVTPIARVMIVTRELS